MERRRSPDLRALEYSRPCQPFPPSGVPHAGRLRRDACAVAVPLVPDLPFPALRSATALPPKCGW
jgi:hypothetical protein